MAVSRRDDFDSLGGHRSGVRVPNTFELVSLGRDTVGPQDSTIDWTEQDYA